VSGNDSAKRKRNWRELENEIENEIEKETAIVPVINIEIKVAKGIMKENLFAAATAGKVRIVPRTRIWITIPNMQRTGCPKAIVKTTWKGVKKGSVYRNEIRKEKGIAINTGITTTRATTRVGDAIRESSGTVIEKR
jgi:hypothetical protein